MILKFQYFLQLSVVLAMKDVFIPSCLKQNSEGLSVTYYDGQGSFLQCCDRSDFEYVEKLTIVNSKDSQFPKDIELFINLKKIVFTKNQGTGKLKGFERLIQLKKLETLEIVENTLSEISDGIRCCRNLKNLIIRDNQLSELPNEISQLTKLKTLNISNNKLINLPIDAIHLTNLQHLYAAGNCFVDFPNEVLFMKKLRSLNLAANKIQKLPETQWKLSKLTSLNLSYNELTELNSDWSLLSNLRSLYLMNNAFTTFPSTILTLKNLHLVYLDGNPINLTSSDISKISQKAFTSIYIDGFVFDSFKSVRTNKKSLKPRFPREPIRFYGLFD